MPIAYLKILLFKGGLAHGAIYPIRPVSGLHILLQNFNYQHIQWLYLLLLYPLLQLTNVERAVFSFLLELAAGADEGRRKRRSLIVEKRIELNRAIIGSAIFGPEVGCDPLPLLVFQHQQSVAVPPS